jgi:hypothetical protein
MLIHHTGFRVHRILPRVLSPESMHSPFRVRSTVHRESPSSSRIVPGHLMDVCGQLTSFTNIGTCECSRAGVLSSPQIKGTKCTTTRCCCILVPAVSLNAGTRTWHSIQVIVWCGKTLSTDGDCSKKVERYSKSERTQAVVSTSMFNSTTRDFSACVMRPLNENQQRGRICRSL